MFLRTYSRLYAKMLGDSFSWLLTIGSAVVFSVIVSLSLLFVDAPLVLKVIPAILFFLNVIAIFMEDPSKGNMGQLFSFLKITPIPKWRIIGANYMCKTFGIDQLVLYGSLCVVFLCFQQEPFAVFMFFIRLFVLLFIAQTMEYAYVYYKEKFFYHFMLPVMLLIVSLVLSHSNRFDSQWLSFLEQYYDVAVLLLFALAILVCPIVTNKLLVAKKSTVPLLIIQISNLTAKLSHISLMTSHRKRLVSYQLRAYVRNIHILSKYSLITSLTVVYSTISYLMQGNANHANNLMIMAYIMSIYFFSEIKLHFLLEKHSLLRLFPVPAKVERRVIQSCGMLFVSFFGCIGLIYRYLLLDTSLSILLSSLLFLLCCYFISACMHIKIPPSTKKERFKLIGIYSVCCMVALVLFLRLDLLIGLLIVVLLGWYANSNQSK